MSSVVVGLVVLAIGAYLVSRDADDLLDAVRRLGVGTIVLAGLLGLLGTVTIGQVWLALLRGMAVPATQTAASAVFFVSQLGKYLPGSVWPVLAQMEMGRRWGAARRTMVAANLLMIAMIAATGLVAGALLLPFSSSRGLGHYWWALLALAPLAVLLHPRAVPALLDAVLRRLGRDPLGVRVSARATVVALAWCVVTWVLMGLHLAVMTTALGAHGTTAVVAAIGGMGLGWAAGLLFIPAPAGAGVRDAVLVATFAPLVGTSAALAVALASRVLLLLADVTLAGLGALATPLRGGSASS